MDRRLFVDQPAFPRASALGNRLATTPTARMGRSRWAYEVS